VQRPCGKVTLLPLSSSFPLRAASCNPQVLNSSEKERNNPSLYSNANHSHFLSRPPFLEATISDPCRYFPSHPPPCWTCRGYRRNWWSATVTSRYLASAYHCQMGPTICLTSLDRSPVQSPRLTKADLSPLTSAFPVCFSFRKKCEIDLWIL
jgi:hypothetical protein